MDCVISISFSKSAIIDYINFLITNLSTLISPSGSPHHHFYQILHFFFFKTFLYGLRLTFTITVIYSLPIPPFTSHPYPPSKGKLQNYKKPPYSAAPSHDAPVHPCWHWHTPASQNPLAEHLWKHSSPMYTCERDQLCCWRQPSLCTKRTRVRSDLRRGGNREGEVVLLFAFFALLFGGLISMFFSWKSHVSSYKPSGPTHFFLFHLNQVTKKKTLTRFQNLS